MLYKNKMFKMTCVALVLSSFVGMAAADAQTECNDYVIIKADRAAQKALGGTVDVAGYQANRPPPGCVIQGKTKDFYNKSYQEAYAFYKEFEHAHIINNELMATSDDDGNVSITNDVVTRAAYDARGNRIKVS